MSRPTLAIEEAWLEIIQSSKLAGFSLLDATGKLVQRIDDDPALKDAIVEYQRERIRQLRLSEKKAAPAVEIDTLLQRVHEDLSSLQVYNPVVTDLELTEFMHVSPERLIEKLLPVWLDMFGGYYAHHVGVTALRAWLGSLSWKAMVAMAVRLDVSPSSGSLERLQS